MSCFMLILTWEGIIFVDILHRAKTLLISILITLIAGLRDQIVKKPGKHR